MARGLPRRALRPRSLSPLAALPHLVPSLSDNVTIHLDGVLYVRIVDAYAASYGVEDPEFAVSQLAQTTMRSELGRCRQEEAFLFFLSLSLFVQSGEDGQAVPIQRLTLYPTAFTAST